MELAYIALGSNLDSAAGNRQQTLSAAVERLRALGTLAARSSLYETDPVGFENQGKFLNAVVALETESEPAPLLRYLLKVERELGRDRAAGVPKGPRTLDLDLLLMGDMVMHSEELILPHPAWAQRRFVLAPLAEVAGGLRPPGSNCTVAETLAALPDTGEQRADGVRRLPEVW